jgi:AcrR family transcriptional regulator
MTAGQSVNLSIRVGFGMKRELSRISKLPEDRRADLLAAAARVVSDHGIERTTVADITSAAGVAKGTFYLYFDSKEEILDALSHRLSEQGGDRIAALPRPSAGDGAGWADFTERLVQIGIEFHIALDVHEVLMRDAHCHGQRTINGLHDPVRAALIDIIEAGRAAGAYDVEDPEMMAQLLHDVVHAAGEQVCQRPTDRDRITATTISAVKRALLA